MRYRSKQPFYLAKDYEAQIVAKNKHRLDIWPAIPCFEAREFPSLGWRTTAWSWIFGSVIETVSDPEFEYALTLHAEPGVTRLRCQQALEYPDTKRIAGAKHPKVREGDIVMSTDFVVYRSDSGIETPTAVAVKNEEHINDARVLEKVSFERAYWLERGIDFKIKLDTDINQVVVQNVLLVWDLWREEILPCNRADKEAALTFLEPHMAAGNLPYAAACRLCDRAMGFMPGTALAVAHHAIIRRIWPIDFTREIVPHRALPYQAR